MGTAFSDFSGLVHYIDAHIGGRDVKEYNKTGDDLTVGTLNAAEIHYIFSEDKLYGVGVDFDKMTNAQWTTLSKALAEQYGEVPELLLDNSPAYVWWGEKSFVRLKRSLDTFYLDIWSRYFLPGQDTEQDVFERALELGDMPRVKKMLDAKPDLVKATDDEQKTPLLWSMNCHPAKSGDEILEFLISKGADVNAKAKDGTTPLYRAATFGALPTVKLLVDKGATVDMKAWHGETALHDAAQGGKTELAKLLVSKGADVNAKDDKGNTPLRYAEDDDLPRIIELLKQHGGTD